MVPFRASYGTQKNGIAVFARFHGGFRQALAVFIDGGTSGQNGGVIELMIVFLADGIQHFDGFAHDLRADSVSRYYCDIIFQVFASCLHEFFFLVH